MKWVESDGKTFNYHYNGEYGLEIVPFEDDGKYEIFLQIGNTRISIGQTITLHGAKDLAEEHALELVNSFVPEMS